MDLPPTSVELTGTAAAMVSAGSARSTWASEKCMVGVVVAKVTALMMGRCVFSGEQKVTWIRGSHVLL